MRYIAIFINKRKVHFLLAKLQLPGSRFFSAAYFNLSPHVKPDKPPRILISVIVFAFGPSELTNPLAYETRRFKYVSCHYLSTVLAIISIRLRWIGIVTKLEFSSQIFKILSGRNLGTDFKAGLRVDSHKQLESNFSIRYQSGELIADTPRGLLNC